MNALFDRFPTCTNRLPWVRLGWFPTPVQRLELGGAEVWVKRDDLSGPLYGGNKVRKLEFLLADAERAGARRVTTIGGAGSHHALATTVYARERGLATSLALFPQPPTEHVAVVLEADAALGADVRWVPHASLLPAALLAARWAHRNEHPYAVPGGGSNRVGTLGYVAGALELAGQVESGELPVPAVVHVAGGTLGTAAGIALGLALAGLETRLAVTAVVEAYVTNTRRLRQLVAGTASLLEDAGVSCPPCDEILARVTLDTSQLGRGYGHATPAGEVAERAFGEAGLPLDPTYTAKAAAGLMAASGGGGPVLFWNTLSSIEPLARPDASDLARLPGGARRYLDAIRGSG